MSGPKTAEYDIAARISILREHQRMAEAQRRLQDEERRQAGRERLAKARAEADRVERQAARIERLAKSAGTSTDLARPPMPSNADADALERYASGLAAEVARVEGTLQAALSQAASRLSAQALESLGRPQSAEELLSAFAAQSKVSHPAAAEAPEQRRERALKVLGRLSGRAANALPADMEALMADMIDAPDPARAEALELELRLRVQRFNEAEAKREKDIAGALDLLAKLPDSAECDAARQDLELIAAGMAELSDAVRARVRDALAAHEETLARERCEDASQVLEKTLGDLGYAVEGIENTLFVEGGVAHINKAEWGDYYVRLRVDPREQTVNFNMVREAGEERSREADQAAEDTWCSGLPQLMKTLEARGLAMKLKRHVAAGALPVQTVAPGSVPAGLKTTSKRKSSAPQARTMKPT